ncbi:MAG TPA: integrin alpha, partial [bacterium]
MKIQQCFWVIGVVILSCVSTLFAQPEVTGIAGDMNSTIFPNATFISRNADERIGYSISGAGDVNGDGYDDFMVAEYHNYVHGWNSGGVYLILGDSGNKWGQNVNIEQAADAIFRGSQDYDMAGYNVAGKGDFNGDGLSDLIVGAP